MIGKTLGHYEITAKIGEGGMGQVYRARDAKLGRDVALKILPPAASADPERRQRFEREAQAVASLQHPHIVTIHSIEEADDVHFLTMELVRGKTLDALIPTDGLPLQRLFEIGIPLAEAVHAAHERGVVHRDLKPGNVMIDDAGRPKVLDFGLAKLISVAPDEAETMAAGDATGEGLVLGTVAYMSPEQAQGKELDSRSDIFSLGVMLYEAATGKQPFSGDTPISTLSAILRDTPSAVTSLKPVPRHLGRIIHRCLEKHPDKRFQTARDVANELEGLQREVSSGELDSISTGAAHLAAAHAARPARSVWPWLTGVAVIIAAVVAGVLLSRRPTDSSTPLVTRRLTSHAAAEGAGSWSPDGSFFAFDGGANGPLDVFVSATVGGDPICLVQSPADDFSPRWSPDNRWIAFVSGRDGTTGLYLVAPLGGPVRRLVETDLEVLGEEIMYALGVQPWSPDGRRLVFARRRDDQVALWIVDIDTGSETRLTNPSPGQIDAQPSWSFDGRWIAFLRQDAGEMTIAIVPAGGGDVRTVHSAGWLQLPAWSPDGDEVLYVSDVGGIQNLWTVAVSNGATRRITSSSIHISGAAVGRDGRILYHDFSHQTDLYLQRLDGSDARRLTFHTETNFGARISPGGDRIVYQSNRAGNDDLWLLDLDSGAERRLADHPEGDLEADWSPDGDRIVFVSQRTGTPQLWTASPEGGPPVRITDQDGVVGPPRWAPDGSAIGFLAATDEGQALWVMDGDGGNPRPVLPHVYEFDWYRDSRHVIYTPSATPTEMRARDLETGEDVLLLDEPHIEAATAPDGSALTYCTAISHYNMYLQLARLEATETGLPRVAETETVADGGGLWHVHNGGFSPDGTSVVYTRDTDTGDVYVLEGVF